MKKVFLLYYVFLSFIGISCASSTPLQQTTINNTIVGNFALLDHTGKFHELYYYSDARAVVLVWQGNGCPILRKSIAYLEGLNRQFSFRGVVLFLINPNLQDDRASIQQEVKDFGITIPILEDPSQVVSASLGIERTATAIVIDTRNWSMVYQGPIHDQFGYETQKTKNTQEFLRDTLNALLKNKSIPKQHAAVKGCLINFSSQESPTYVKDVAPIFINKCLVCHSPAQIAPWSMDNYEKVKGWGSMIREVVRTRRMPPWGADPHYRKLKDDVSLTPQELKIINDWVGQGMARGEGEDPLLKAQRPPIDEWPLGSPDMVLTFDKIQDVPAAGPGTGSGDLRNINMREMMEQDVWVRAIYWKIDNRKVVHHANISAYVFKPDVSENIDWFMKSGVDYNLKTHKPPTVENNDHIIDSFSPGKQPLIMPRGVGMFFPKGSRFRAEMHYTPTGRHEIDNTEIGLYFYKEKPAKVFSFQAYPRYGLIIPPFKKEHSIRHSFTFKKNVTLYSIRPHMHLRGRSQDFTFYYPNGTSERVLSVPQYRFQWQRRYSFEIPFNVPAGTRVEMITVYDNSSQNLDNPDPSQRVLSGNYTNDEMLFPTFFYVEE